MVYYFALFGLVIMSVLTGIFTSASGILTLISTIGFVIAIAARHFVLKKHNGNEMVIIYFFLIITPLAVLAISNSIMLAIMSFYERLVWVPLG